MCFFSYYNTNINFLFLINALQNMNCLYKVNFSEGHMETNLHLFLMYQNNNETVDFYKCPILKNLKPKLQEIY